MIVSDPIGDMLIQIKNAALSRKNSVILPYSKIRLAVAQILVKEGYLTAVDQANKIKGAKLELKLAYKDKLPVISGVKRVSKPGQRWYVNKKSIPQVMGGLGVAVVSTPKGVMTGKEAKVKGLGGEFLCEIW